MSRYTTIGAVILCTMTAALQSRGAQDVTGGPRGAHPYLFKSASEKRLVETGRDHRWSVTFRRKSGADTIHIIALRVEFNNGKPDTSALTAGNGLFSIRGAGDKGEYNLYTSSDTVYKYDRLPHDSSYFAFQLEALAGYYSNVSRGKLVLRSTIYPTKGGDTGYAVSQPMTYYSPGGKKKKETYDEYYYRKTKGLMFFIRDAILAAAGDPNGSPFAKLRIEPSDNTLRDEFNQKTVILIFHAGSSYLTDGGKNGPQAANSPSDMIDAFINASWFRGFKDSLKLKTAGVPVQGGGDTIVIDELMMCSETSNQDGLNWGIQGILVNQMARQLGIPDLWATSSGVSAVGAFCIMDVASYYLGGNGFIPPYPSAWVRAFMGWDEAKLATPGAASSHTVKALAPALGRGPPGGNGSAADTTILLVPMNDHEYYLIENRQRNLSGNDSLFAFDSVDQGRVIKPYPYNVNLDSNVLATSGKGAKKSNVILKVKNNDISLPASGVLAWHVDERLIRDRLEHNLVNADSLYRGVALMEADGVSDLGITFQDIFSQAAYDYGGAEDVFPHRTEKKNASPSTVSGFGPYSRPSSMSNDGGNTYLYLDIGTASKLPREEKSGIRDYVVTNFADSAFTINISWDYLVPGWPKFAAPERFYEPLLANLDTDREGRELVLLSKLGRLYAWSSDTGSKGITYGNRPVIFDRIDVKGDTIQAADTAVCIDSIPGSFTLPSEVLGTVFFPSRECGVRVLEKLSSSGARWDTIPLGGVPSSYACRYGDSVWAIGCEGGRLIFGRASDTVSSLRLSSDSAVCAIAAVGEKAGSVAVIQRDGTLSLVTAGAAKAEASARVPNGIGPYTLVTGDLDRDDKSEIVVCDSRHGLWVYRQTMALAPGWEEKPSDWPSAYHYAPASIAAPADRSKLAENLSPPALVDLNRDGYLDIVVGGSNGLYAFNYKGALVGGWPSYLDNRFWYQRGDVVAAPIAVTGTNREPLVIFSSPTGSRATFYITKIIKADKNKGMVWFKNEANALDSIWDLSKPLIDTLLTLNDSLVAPYITPGGFVDAVKGNGKRPLIGKSIVPAGLAQKLDPFFSSWPLSTGAALTTSPLAGQTGTSGSSPDLFAVATNGWVYRWKLAREIMPDSLFWPEVGYDAGRSFAYGGGSLPKLVTDTDPITFHSFPNPTRGAKEVSFKYKFSGPASNVRLDIFTFTGFRVFSSSDMGNPPGRLTGSHPDWNVLNVPVTKLGTAVYRCRMEATIGGKKHARFWKLAVTP